MRFFTVRRNVSSMLVIILLFMLCGCNSNQAKHDAVLVGQNESWYSSEVKNYDYEMIGSVDKTLPIYVDSDVVFYKNFYDDDLNEVTNLVCINNDAALVKCIDYSIPFSADSKVDICACFKNDSDYFLVLSVLERGETTSYIGRIDFESSSVTDIETVDFNNISSDYIRISKVIAKKDKLYIEFMYLSEACYKFGFRIIDLSEGVSSDFFVDEDVLNWTLDDNSMITYVAYSKGVSVGSSKSVFKLDSDGNCTIVEIPEDLTVKITTGLLADNGYVSIVNQDLTISIINLSTFEEIIEFNYNNCDASIYELSNSSLMYFDYDTFVFLKEEKYDNTSSFNKIIQLKRMETNPNIGKEIITVAPFLSVSQSEAKALQLFNENNVDYICYVTMDYSMVNFYEILKGNAIVEIDNYYERELIIVDLLEQSILAGDGPDILLGFGQYASLNNSSLLSNLNEYIDSGNGLNREEYFNNLFCAFEQDGDLFQIPLSSCVVGIYTCQENVEPDTIGFTYETYQNLIEEKYGGYDPLEAYYGQLNAFRLLLKSNYSYLFDTPYQIDLENDAFTEMAEYTNSLCEYYEGNYYIDDIDVAFLSNFYNETYNMILMESGYGLYGLPSFEVQSPIAEIYTSAAITTCSNVPEISWDFIKLCLSEDAQLIGDSNPINRNAFINKANNILIEVNNHIEEEYGIHDYYDGSIIDIYIEYLSSAHEGAQIDSVTMVIMNEELALYFNGDKLLEEVIPVIESRVNNMLSERKP